MVFQIFRTRDDAIGMLDCLYYLKKFLATSPYTRYKNSDNEYIYCKEKACLKNIIPIINISLLAPLLIYCGYYFNIKIQSSVELGNIVLWIVNIGCAVYAVATPLVHFFKQEEYLDIFYTMKSIDDGLKKINISFSCRLYHIGTVALAVIIGTLIFGNHLFYVFIVGKSQGQQMMETIVYHGSFVIRQWPLYYHFSFMLFVIVRTWYLNDYVEKWNLHNLGKKKLQENIFNLSDINLKLWQLTEHLNNVFSFLMLLNIVITSLLMLNVVPAFCGYLHNVVELLIWLAFNIVPTWAIIIAAQITSFQCKKISQSLIEVTIPIAKEELSLNVMCLLLQNYHTKVEFHGGRFFILEMSLIVTHLNTMASLTMFLLSFKNNVDL